MLPPRCPLYTLLARSASAEEATKSRWDFCDCGPRRPAQRFPMLTSLQLVRAAASSAPAAAEGGPGTDSYPPKADAEVGCSKPFAERAPSRHSPGLGARRKGSAAECIPQSCPAGASRLQKACCRARARARWSRRRQFGPKVRSYSFFRGDDKKQTVDVRTEKR